MKPLAENLPSVNDLKQQGIALSKPSSPSKRTKQDVIQLRSLITQSFEVFNVYGKEPESVESIIRAFNFALEGYSLAEITKAFKSWMHGKTVMPTPADILGIAKENRKHAREVAAQKAAPAQREERAPEVAWYGLSWVEIERRGMVHAVEDHIEMLFHTKGKEYAADYRRYLKNGPQNAR